MEKIKNILDSIASLERGIQETGKKIGDIASGMANITCPQELFDLESTLRGLAHQQSDLIAASLLQKALAKAESSEETKKLINSIPYKMKNYGQRMVKVRMAGGTEIELVTSYYARACKEKKSEGLGYSLP
jgi:hypothetical protein